MGYAAHSPIARRAEHLHAAFVSPNAFIDQPAGLIEIKLEGVTQLDLVVEDNGAGCSEDCPPGVGSRLVQILVQQLNGTLERRNQAKGCRVAISFPA